jgi:hypothetical protein
MHLACFVNATGKKENALSKRGLTRVNMGSDADITGFS